MMVMMMMMMMMVVRDEGYHDGADEL